jgi:hypothetical protein
MTTRDEKPEPVTEWDAVDRILAETSLSDDALDRLALPPIDLSGLTPLDDIENALGLTPLDEIADALGLTPLEDVPGLVDLDRLIAETAPPLEDATVVALVAETLGRDPLP